MTEPAGPRPVARPSRLRHLAAGSPARWLLAIGFPFGLLFAGITPPLQPPDEMRHLARAFLISEGRFGAQIHDGKPQVWVPRSLARMPMRLGEGIQMDPDRRQEGWRLEREFRVPVRPDVRVWRSMPSLYSPLVYLPSALAVGLGRLLERTAVELLYLGRLANLAAYLALVALALRWIPAHRLALGLLALLPMSVFLAASLNGDAVTLGLAFLVVAAIWREAARPEPLDRRALLGLGALAAAIGLAKPGYALAVALVLAIPARRFASRSRRAAAIGFWLACGLLPGALWAVYIVSLGTEPTVAEAGGGETLRWVVQLCGVLADPLGFLVVLVRSVLELGWIWVTSFVGLLGHADTFLPGWVYPAAVAVLLSVALLDGDAASPVRGRARALALALAALGGGVLLTVGYLGWNEVDSPLVRGVQGRYLAPFAPLLVPALHWPGAPPLPWWARLGALAAAALFLAVAVLRVGMRYWG